jgi:hypothetical protein
MIYAVIYSPCQKIKIKGEKKRISTALPCLASASAYTSTNQPGSYQSLSSDGEQLGRVAVNMVSPWVYICL